MLHTVKIAFPVNKMSNKMKRAFKYFLIKKKTYYLLGENNLTNVLTVNVMQYVCMF